MNTYTILLSSNSSNHVETLPEISLNDITTVGISLSGIDETIPPTTLVIDWGDGIIEEFEASEILGSNNVIPSIVGGKESAFARQLYDHVIYPHSEASSLSTIIQALITYSNGNTNYFKIPLNIDTAGFFDTVEDYKIIGIYESGSTTTYKLLTKKGYVVEMRK
jgi:hypothetical protein